MDPEIPRQRAKLSGYAGSRDIPECATTSAIRASSAQFSRGSLAFFARTNSPQVIERINACIVPSLQSIAPHIRRSARRRPFSIQACTSGTGSAEQNSCFSAAQFHAPRATRARHSSRRYPADTRCDAILPVDLNAFRLRDCNVVGWLVTLAVDMNKFGPPQSRDVAVGVLNSFNIGTPGTRRIAETIRSNCFLSRTSSVTSMIAPSVNRPSSVRLPDS